VDLTREYTFSNSKQKFKGVPLMASNMDTVGTFEMAATLAEVSARGQRPVYTT
jgi:GMP reductase